MTGEDHNTDALIAALRSPALPEEQRREADAVTAMLEVLQTVPARSGLRSRRGIAIAAVTVASLGVGGLVAAGPGIFRPAADTPPTTSSSDARVTSGPVSAVGHTVDDASEVSIDAVPNALDGSAGGDAEPQAAGEVECAGGNHGETVSSIARSSAPAGTAHGERVSDAARSDCGNRRAGDRADAATDPAAIECVEGNHGATVSDVARASLPEDERRGATVSGAARSDCGKPDGALAGDDTGDDETGGSTTGGGVDTPVVAVPTPPNKPETPAGPPASTPPTPDPGGNGQNDDGQNDGQNDGGRSDGAGQGRSDQGNTQGRSGEGDTSD